MLVEEWQQEQAKMKELAMQQQQQEMQNNPAVMKAQVEMAKVQQSGQELQVKAQMHQEQFKLDIERLKQDQLKILTDLSIAKDNSMTQRIKAEAERFSKQVELAMQKKDMQHRHFREAIETHNKVHVANHQAETTRMQHNKQGATIQ
jgi:hypothetical protein